MNGLRRAVAIVAAVLMLAMLVTTVSCSKKKCDICGGAIEGQGHVISGETMCDDCYEKYTELQN